MLNIVTIKLTFNKNHFYNVRHCLYPIFLLHYVYIIMTFNIHFKKFISNLFNIDFKYCPK